MALYFAQGLPFGFQATALPIYLRSRGASLTDIGLASALAVPWMLKVLWAPAVDRYGSRRTWIGFANLGLTLCAVMAAGLTGPSGEHGLAPLVAVLLVMNFLAATQDIAVDGLAVDILGPRQLGWGNAAQVVGYKLGMVTGGGLLVWASGDLGWPGTFGAMALVYAALLPLTLALPKGRRYFPGRTLTSLRAVVQRMVEAVRAQGAVAVLAVVATYKVGEVLVDLMWKPFLFDAGFTAPQLGLWVGTWGMGASLLGSLAGGWLVARIGVDRALQWTALLRLPPMLAEAWLTLATPTATDVIAVTIAEHACGGALTTAMFAWMMARVDRRIGASHFTLLASVEVAGKAPAGWISGWLAERLGYGWLFVAGAVLSAAWAVGIRRFGR